MVFFIDKIALKYKIYFTQSETLLLTTVPGAYPPSQAKEYWV